MKNPAKHWLLCLWNSKAILFIIVLAFVAIMYFFVGKSFAPPAQPEIKDFIEQKLVAMPAVGYFGGILEGFSYYFSFPLWFIQVVFLLGIGTLKHGIDDFLVGVYVLLWMLMPSINFEPTDFVARTTGSLPF